MRNMFIYQFVILFLALIGLMSSASAQDIEWALNIGGEGSDFVEELTVDEAGNIYATGSFYSDSVEFGGSEDELTLASAGAAQDLFVCKYTSNGKLIWAKVFGSGSTDKVNDIAIDSLGNVYITGYFYGPIDFDPGPDDHYVYSTEQNDAYVLKLDSDGDFVWVKTFVGEKWISGHALDVSQNGYVFIAGKYRGIVDLDPDDETVLLFGSTDLNTSDEFFVVKLDSAGSFVWGHGFSSYQDDWVFDLIVLESGDILISGAFSNDLDFDPGPDEFVLDTGSSQKRGFLLKMDSDGSLLWARQYGDPGHVFASSISVNSNNQLLLTGTFNGNPVFSIDGSEIQFNELSHQDIFVMQLDWEGNPMWFKVIQTENESNSTSLSLDVNDNIYVTGSFRKSADLNPGDGEQWETAPDLFFMPFMMFVLKLDSIGDFQWAHAIADNSSAYGKSIVVTESGAIHVGGSFTTTQNMAPEPEEFFLSVHGNSSSDGFILKWNKESEAPVPPVESDFCIYPNPAESVINVKTGLRHGALEVVSSRGELIVQQAVEADQEEIAIPLSRLNNGLYIIRFYNEQFLEVRKFEKF